MREIKFRAFYKGKIYNVVEIDFACKTITLSDREDFGDEFDVELDEVELMQFTGLKDKNRKEVFEGDIVEGYIDSFKVIGEIIFSNASFWFRPLRVPEDSGISLRTHYGIPKKTVVIGNKFDNPELLKGGKNMWEDEEF